MISLISFAIAEKQRISLSTEKRKRSNKTTLEDRCFLLVAYAGEVSSKCWWGAAVCSSSREKRTHPLRGLSFPVVRWMIL